jgi:hypothetical protein
MPILQRDLAAVRQSIALWVASSEDVRRSTAPALLIRMIDLMSAALRQEFAKDQISKAINAISRGDTGSAGIHMTLALREIPRAPVEIGWNDLRNSAAKLGKGQAAAGE